MLQQAMVSPVSSIPLPYLNRNTLFSDYLRYFRHGQLLLPRPVQLAADKPLRFVAHVMPEDARFFLEARPKPGDASAQGLVTLAFSKDEEFARFLELTKRLMVQSLGTQLTSALISATQSPP